MPKWYKHSMPINLTQLLPQWIANQKENKLGFHFFSFSLSLPSHDLSCQTLLSRCETPFFLWPGKGNAFLFWTLIFSGYLKHTHTHTYTYTHTFATVDGRTNFSNFLLKTKLRIQSTCPVGRSTSRNQTPTCPPLVLKISYFIFLLFGFSTLVEVLAVVVTVKGHHPNGSSSTLDCSTGIHSHQATKLCVWIQLKPKKASKVSPGNSEQ